MVSVNFPCGRVRRPARWINLRRTAVARLVGESWQRVAAIAERYVELALAEADYSQVTELAIDETSKARGHDYVTIAADTERRAVIFVTETREAAAIARLAGDLRAHGGDPEAIRAVSIDMSSAYIKGWPSTCQTPRSPSTSSTSSPMPLTRWI